MPSVSPYTEEESFEERSNPFEVEWHKKAACFSKGFDTFFHEGPLRVQEVAREAKQKFCYSCPVRDICLQSSLEYRDKFGIWGGLTTKERKRLLKQIDDGEMTIEQAVDMVCHESAAA